MKGKKGFANIIFFILIVILLISIFVLYGNGIGGAEMIIFVLLPSLVGVVIGYLIYGFAGGIIGIIIALLLGYLYLTNFVVRF